MSDTLAQKYLIELLMWNASGVHKQSPKVWQEKLDDWAGNQCRWILSLSLLKATVPSDKSAVVQIAKNPTVDWNLLKPKLWGRFRCSIIQNENWKKRHAGTWLSRLPLTIIGNAGTSIQRPRSISQNVIAVFVGCRTMTFPAAPCKHISKTRRNKSETSTH